MLGYSLEEIQGMLFKDIVHASRKDKWSQYLSTILSKDIEHIEIDIHKKDGIIVPAEVKIVLIKNDTGKEHIWLSARDISKRKKSENDLVEKDKLLISIVENIPDMIFVKDAKNLNYVHFNKAGEDLLGFSKEELIGRNDYDYFSKEMADIFTKKDRETIRSDRHLHIPEENINTKLGRRILSTKKFTLKDRSGNPAFLIGISRDITERKQAETKLIESEAYYRTLVNISPDGILVTDLNGVIRFGSEKLAQIFEVSGNETLGGKSAFDWIAPESMEKAKMDFNALIGGIKPSQSIIYKALKFDRTEFWIELSFSLLHDAFDKPNGVMITCRDITKRKKNEEELNTALQRAEEANRLKSAFLANVNHEIRTPMNGIMGFTELLNEPGLDVDIKQEYISLIKESGDRLLTTINDIVEISRIESGQSHVIMSAVDLNDQMKEIVRNFCMETEKQDVRLSITDYLPDQHTIIKSDKDKLSSIIKNLIRNAIKFNDKGSIELGYVLKQKDKPNEIMFYIKDTGLGIPKERLKAVFNPFVKADIEDRSVFEGLGLGLAICKAYIEILGGKIWVESEVGIGTQFYFSLPYCSPGD